jgi:hypothetical protein
MTNIVIIIYVIVVVVVVVFVTYIIGVVALNVVARVVPVPSSRNISITSISSKVLFK